MNASVDAVLTALADLIAERVAERLSLSDGNRKDQTRAEAPKPDFCSEQDLALRSGLSRRTLQGWRQRGGGPLWVKVGRRVLYPRPDAEAFLQGRSLC